MDRIVIPRIYAFPCGSQKLILTSPVLEMFCGYRQMRLEPEAGGLLFAEFDFSDVRIVEATPPGKKDKRSRISFAPDRAAQRQIIQERFAHNRHFMGEWHTHPEPHPKPSRLDLDSMTDVFLKSKHELDSFIMIIVGNQADALHLWVSAHTGTGTCRMSEALV